MDLSLLNRTIPTTEMISLMETQLPDSRKWFTRRRLVIFTCFALLAGLVSGTWILRLGPLQREVEALGGTYYDQSLNFPSRITIANLKRLPRGLFQIAQGKSRHIISIGFHNTGVSNEWVEQNKERLKSLPVASLDFHRTKISDETVTHLSGMKTLVALDLTGTSITDQSMSVLRQLPNLQHVDLSDTNVTSDGISQLVKFPRLYTLDISGDILSTETVTHLNAMPQLRSLRLTRFDSHQLSRLDGIKKLEYLSLRGATDQSLSAIPLLRQLQRLTLEDSQLSDQSVETIRKTFPNLRIHQRMSHDRSLELGIPQMLAAERRLKRTVFIAFALGVGSLTLLIVILWRQRSRRHSMS